jgi:hypothetical protein
MALPGLFVEYLVSGSLALLWIIPAVGANAAGLDKALLLMLAPSLYVVGMLVDCIGFLVFSFPPNRKYSLKHWIRRRALAKVTKEEREFFTGPDRERVKYWIRQHAPDITREKKMHSSRDRIARCAVVNLMIAAMAAFAASGSEASLLKVSGWVWLGAAALSLHAWVFFEYLSYRFELRTTLEARRYCETEG